MLLRSTTLLFFFLKICFCAPAQIHFQDLATKKYGFRDHRGNVVVPAEYDKLSATFDTLMIPEKNGLEGIINNRGEVIVPFEYKDLRLEITPYGHQHGFIIASKDKRNYGILDPQGKVVLPFQYPAFPVALDPNFLAGQTQSEKSVHFFDGRGKPLFTVPGKRAFAGFDDKTVKIEGLDNRLFFIFKKDGKQVFPAHLPYGKWTDGNIIVYGQYSPYGIINFRGDTILSFEYEQIRPTLPGQFHVKAKGYREGIVDARGRFVIPLDTQDIKLWEKTYVARRHSANALFDASGKQILPFEYDIQRAGDVKRGFQIPERNIYHYFQVVHQKTRKMGFFSAKTGAQILPVEFTNVRYYSDLYPLIALKYTPENQLSETQAFDFEGKPLLPRPVSFLQLTQNPRVLIGILERDGASGFIHLDSAFERTAFIYRDLRETADGFYTGKAGGVGVVLSADGKRLFSGEYASLSAPQDFQKKLFEESPEVAGTLVAVLRTNETPPKGWIGVTDEARLFYVEPNENRPVELPPTGKLPPELRAAEDTPSDDSKIWKYEEISVKPEFPGGRDSMEAFIQRHLQLLPGVEKMEPQKKRVFLSFVVEIDGSLSDIKGRPMNNGLLEKEAIRVISLMPKWIPGRAGKHPVRCMSDSMVRFGQ